MIRFLFILFCCVVSVATYAQEVPVGTGDSGAATPAVRHRPVRRIQPRRDTAIFIRPDSATAPVLADTIPADSLKRDTLLSQQPIVPQQAANKESSLLPIDSIYYKLLDNPFLRSRGKPVFLVVDEKVVRSKDNLFYMLAGLLFLLGLIKLTFSRYFTDIFRQFIQPSFRQKQTREQLLQNNLPSLLLNLFFIFSAGIFIALLMGFYHLSGQDFEQNFLYSVGVLLMLYLGKYVVLNFAGWVFNAQDATGTYIFIVFLVNKIMGIVLIPFSLLIAFSSPSVIQFSVNTAVFLVVVLLLYRFIAAAGSARREVKLNLYHFVFYVLAFEITPLLLIYKTLGIYLGKSA